MLSQEDVEIMPEAADRILAELGALRGQLDRLETRIERVEVLGAKVAVLERQDSTDQTNGRRLEARVGQLESQAWTIYRLEGLEAQVASKRNEVAQLREALASKAASADLAAESGRITALETDRARGEGMSRAMMLVWTVITAAPGLIGLGLALWKLQS